MASSPSYLGQRHERNRLHAYSIRFIFASQAILLTVLMSIRQSVFGEVAVRSGLSVSGADIEGLLRRLLLFETVTVRSVRLREIPFLVRAFGKDGFLQLLDSGALKISCEFAAVILEFKTNGVRSEPLFHFSFGIADLAKREQTLGSEMRLLQSVPGLKNNDRARLEEAIMSKLVRPPSNYGEQLQTQVESDLRTNTPALALSVSEHLKKQFGMAAPSVNLRVEETKPRVFRIVNDLPKLLGVSEQEAHDFLHFGVGAVAHIDQRVADMAAYSAITGFSESEAPLLFGKLSGIIGPLNPDHIERQFGRVATIADFPDLKPAKRIDVGRLLAARDSPELREFREWLCKLDGLSDAQVRDLIGGVKNRIGFLIRSSTGKALRLAATTALGLAGPAAGVAAGALDTFLLERLFPSSGVFAFLTATYPSLFESP